MSLAGIAHLVLMMAALALGLRILSATKGTVRHRRLGRAFVGCMLVSNVLVLGIYEDARTPGVFHLLAVVSFASLVAGTWLARMPGRGRRIAHGHVMAWSYGGLVAAGAGQGATALGLAPWPAILACLALTGLALWRADLGAMLGAR